MESEDVWGITKVLISLELEEHEVLVCGGMPFWKLTFYSPPAYYWCLYPYELLKFLGACYLGVWYILLCRKGWVLELDR